MVAITGWLLRHFGIVVLLWLAGTFVAGWVYNVQPALWGLGFGACIALAVEKRKIGGRLFGIGSALFAGWCCAFNDPSIFEPWPHPLTLGGWLVIALGAGGILLCGEMAGAGEP